MATREQNIQHLTTNCSCWKNKDKVLANKDQFTDAEIAALRAGFDNGRSAEAVVNAVRSKYPKAATLTVNAMPAFIEEEAPAEEEEAVPASGVAAAKPKGVVPGKGVVPVKAKVKEGAEGLEEEQEDEEDTMPTGNQRPRTAEQWFADAPPPIQAAVRNAMKIERRERMGLVHKLVANVRDPERRKLLINKYKDKSLDELEDLVSLIPPPVVNSILEDDPDPERIPNYAGQGEPVYNDREDDAEPLGVPVMNWAAKK